MSVQVSIERAELPSFAT